MSMSKAKPYTSQDAENGHGAVSESMYCAKDDYWHCWKCGAWHYYRMTRCPRYTGVKGE